MTKKLVALAALAAAALMSALSDSQQLMSFVSDAAAMAVIWSAVVTPLALAGFMVRQSRGRVALQRSEGGCAWSAQG